MAGFSDGKEREAGERDAATILVDVAVQAMPEAVIEGGGGGSRCFVSWRWGRRRRGRWRGDLQMRWERWARGGVECVVGSW